jgi:hypothetical protein
MFIARWQIDAKFGHKQKLIAHMQHWMKEIGPQAGFDKMEMMLTTGSIGAREATIYADHKVSSLAQLEKGFDALAKNEAHQKWGAEMEPLVVSGSTRWEILRII